MNNSKCLDNIHTAITNTPYEKSNEKLGLQNYSLVKRQEHIYLGPIHLGYRWLMHPTVWSYKRQPFQCLYMKCMFKKVVLLALYRLNLQGSKLWGLHKDFTLIISIKQGQCEMSITTNRSTATLLIGKHYALNYCENVNVKNSPCPWLNSMGICLFSTVLCNYLMTTGRKTKHCMNRLIYR